MNENELNEYLIGNERETADAICDILRKNELNILEYLVDFVASLCHVNREDILSTSKKADVTQARWFFIYTYRYMTNDSYDKIRTFLKGTALSDISITGLAFGANKMSSLVVKELTWRKRWIIMKRVITNYKEHIGESKGVEIELVVPNGISVKIKKQQQ